MDDLGGGGGGGRVREREHSFLAIFVDSKYSTIFQITRGKVP